MTLHGGMTSLPGYDLWLAWRGDDDWCRIHDCELEDDCDPDSGANFKVCPVCVWEREDVSPSQRKEPSDE